MDEESLFKENQLLEYEKLNLVEQQKYDSHEMLLSKTQYDHNNKLRQPHNNSQHSMLQQLSSPPMSSSPMEMSHGKLRQHEQQHNQHNQRAHHDIHSSSVYNHNGTIVSGARKENWNSQLHRGKERTQLLFLSLLCSSTSTSTSSSSSNSSSAPPSPSPLIEKQLINPIVSASLPSRPRMKLSVTDVENSLDESIESQGSIDKGELFGFNSSVFLEPNDENEESRRLGQSKKMTDLKNIEQTVVNTPPKALCSRIQASQLDTRTICSEHEIIEISDLSDGERDRAHHNNLAVVGACGLTSSIADLPHTKNVAASRALLSKPLTDSQILNTKPQALIALQDPSVIIIDSEDEETENMSINNATNQKISNNNNNNNNNNNANNDNNNSILPASSPIHTRVVNTKFGQDSDSILDSSFSFLNSNPMANPTRVQKIDSDVNYSNIENDNRNHNDGINNNDNKNNKDDDDDVDNGDEFGNLIRTNFSKPISDPLRIFKNDTSNASTLKTGSSTLSNNRVQRGVSMEVLSALYTSITKNANTSSHPLPAMPSFIKWLSSDEAEGSDSPIKVVSMAPQSTNNQDKGQQNRNNERDRIARAARAFASRSSASFRSASELSGSEFYNKSPSRQDKPERSKRQERPERPVFTSSTRDTPKLVQRSKTDVDVIPSFIDTSIFNLPPHHSTSETVQLPAKRSNTAPDTNSNKPKNRAKRAKTDSYISDLPKINNFLYSAKELQEVNKVNRKKEELHAEMEIHIGSKPFELLNEYKEEFNLSIFQWKNNDYSNGVVSSSNSNNNTNSNADLDSNLLIIFWKRRVRAEYIMEKDFFIPCPPKKVTQRTFVIYLLAHDFITKLQNKTLQSDLTKARDFILAKCGISELKKGYHVILMVEGYDQLVGKIKAHRQRLFKSQVLLSSGGTGQQQRLPNKNSPSKKRKADEILASYPDPIDIEKMLNQFQLDWQVNIFAVRSREESVNWLNVFTYTIASSLYDKYERNEQLANLGNVRSGSDTKTTFLQSMQQFTRMTQSKAEILYLSHKSMHLVYSKLKADATLGKDAIRNNIVPPTVDNAMFNFFTSDDPDKAIT